jgi:hypothetical protein
LGFFVCRGHLSIGGGAAVGQRCPSDDVEEGAGAVDEHGTELDGEDEPEDDQENETCMVT